MSSTRTSRSWRVTWSWPEPSCSSSNTVGVVRTGIPRSRQAVTTRARSVPGADGIAITTSSGSTSSRTRARSSLEVVPSTFSPYSSFIPCLRGSSSTNPTGRSRSCGVAHELADDQPAAVAAADDQDVAGALADPEAAHPALDDQVHEEPRADQERERQQQEQRDHARGERRPRLDRRRTVVCWTRPATCVSHRMQQRDRADDHARVATITPLTTAS